MLISSGMRAWIGWLTLVGAAACSRGAAPEPAVLPCAADTDCVWASGCCNDCTAYSGRRASDRVVTRAEQDRVDRICDERDEKCPHVDCVSPPPCALQLRPVCRAGACAVEASGAPLSRTDGATCTADACGPLPRLGGGSCDDFAQAAYERCACLAAGRTDCGVAMWGSLCGARAACAPADPPAAMATALAGCDPGTPATSK
jgi:hypothetical protein